MIKYGAYAKIWTSGPNNEKHMLLTDEEVKKHITPIVLNTLRSAQDLLDVSKQCYIGGKVINFFENDDYYTIDCKCVIASCKKHKLKKNNQSYLIKHWKITNNSLIPSDPVIIELYNFNLFPGIYSGYKLHKLLKDIPYEDKKHVSLPWVEKKDADLEYECVLCKNNNMGKPVQEECIICMEIGDIPPQCVHCSDIVDCGVSHHAVHNDCAISYIYQSETMKCPICKKDIEMLKHLHNFLPLSDYDFMDGIRTYYKINH